MRSLSLTDSGLPSPHPHEAAVPLPLAAPTTQHLPSAPAALCSHSAVWRCTLLVAGSVWGYQLKLLQVCSGAGFQVKGTTYVWGESQA